MNPLSRAVDRRDYPTFNIYLRVSDMLEETVMYCMFCTKPFATVVGAVVTMSDASLPIQMIHIGVANTCKNCKQRYRFVVT